MIHVAARPVRIPLVIHRPRPVRIAQLAALLVLAQALATLVLGTPVTA